MAAIIDPKWNYSSTVLHDAHASRQQIGLSRAADGPLRIVHVLTRLLRGGSEENTVASALWQAEQGHHVTLVHGGEPDPVWQTILTGKVDLEPVPEIVHPVHPFADARAIGALRRCYCRLAPDVIHTHQSKAGIVGRLAASSAPMAVVIHGIHIVPFVGEPQLKRSAYVLAERLAARRTDRFIAVSRGTAQAYCAAKICRSDDITVVHSGMHLGPYRIGQPPEDADMLVGRGGFRGERAPVILMLAALEPRKRHVGFLAVFHRILQRVPDAHLLIAGEGSERVAIEKTVVRLGLGRHVTLCGHRSDPHALVALADVTVMTSEREGLPRAVIQSIAGGRPVVVSDLLGIEEIVESGVNGVITPANDLSITADAIATLIAQPDRLKRLSAGARATDVSRWELDRLGEATTTVYLQARRMGQR